MGGSVWFPLLLCAHCMATTRACSPTSVDTKGTTPGPITERQYIVNGAYASEGDFPHQVSLQYTNKGNLPFCGASIIHPRFLLTAAHCVSDVQQRTYIRAVAGAYDLRRSSQPGTEQIRHVSAVFLHNYYSNVTFNNDIALLKLDKPFDFDIKYVHSIKLPDPEWPLPQYAKISGWGTVSGGVYTPSDRLMMARLQIADHSNCTSRYEKYKTDTMLCAGGVQKSCGGDSGGPLTCSRGLTNGQQERYLCGIVSWGDDKCKPDKYLPAVYTNVRAYLEWIFNILPSDRLYWGEDEGRGIVELSLSARRTRTLISSSEDLEGLTFDWINRKIYYATHIIYAANEDGTGVQTVLDSAEYGDVEGLAFDYITRNVYGVSWEGYIFACKVLPNGKLKCANLLTRQGNLQGIALDPNNGKMYWTRYGGGGKGDIMCAQMDGGDAVRLLDNRDDPVGIVIEYDTSRLCWAEYEGHKVYCSNLDGTGVSILGSPLAPGTFPWGIAFLNGSLYYNPYKDKKQQMTTSRWDFPITRKNPCTSQNCDVCVLTASAFRCVG